jgi:hypothetical protein
MELSRSGEAAPVKVLRACHVREQTRARPHIRR